VSNLNVDLILSDGDGDLILGDGDGDDLILGDDDDLILGDGDGDLKASSIVLQAS